MGVELVQMGSVTAPTSGANHETAMLVGGTGSDCTHNHSEGILTIVRVEQHQGPNFKLMADVWDKRKAFGGYEPYPFAREQRDRTPLDRNISHPWNQRLEAETKTSGEAGFCVRKRALLHFRGWLLLARMR
jgi:hypothetical protein